MAVSPGGPVTKDEVRAFLNKYHPEIIAAIEAEAVERWTKAHERPHRCLDEERLARSAEKIGLHMALDWWREVAKTYREDTDA